MAKEYSINIPIIALKPADQIIDYLNGKASLAIVNPFFQLPGVQSPPFANFLTYKPITGQRTGYQIVSPQIVYKTQAGTFTSKIVFNDDDGSSNGLSTNLRFYPLKDVNLTIQDYVAKFKVLQKVVASRGVVKDDNADLKLINECVINYQLSQAYEMALMLKVLCVAPAADDTDETILNKILLQLNNQGKAPTISAAILQKTQSRIKDYIAFNAPPAPNAVDTRYIKSYNQTMMNNFVEKPVIQSIIDVFSLAMREKAKIIKGIQNKSQYDQIFEQYNNIFVGAKYQNMGSACYVKEYEGTAKGQDYQGKSFYTEYTLKIADKSTGKTMMKVPSMGNAQPRPMTVKDYLDLVTDNTSIDPTQAKPKSLAVKIFMSVDFDFRVYLGSAATKQAINVRYLVHLIFYKENQSSIMDSIDYGNVYMPTMEDDGATGGMGVFGNEPSMDDGSQSSETQFTSTQTQMQIPSADGFNAQSMM